ANCADNGIGSFRITSGLFPLRTHPDIGYELDELPNGRLISDGLRSCREFANEHDLRTVFHPDQFVVINSLRPEVVDSSLRELEHHAEIAELVGADVINIHAGGVYGDKDTSLERLENNLSRLSDRVRSRLTLENDDRCYTPLDLLPLCWRNRIPLVYDVHHHRCLPDGFAEEEATEMALSTWNREPLFHISSPIEGWSGKARNRHHDFIDPADLPELWLELNITLEIEAKAKEVAIAKLRTALRL
ncbi:MAG TPA: UV DNA damage repair endonuclease UvsE, partial [candidate division Zixibacteria bacterium]|nr:UV DNA damage repair endonuclease UvsE [candidate division Zixibacteria bacterium]